MTKTNKSVRSRVKITKRGKAIVRGTGIGHLATGKSRRKQLNNKRTHGFSTSKKSEQRYLKTLK